MININSEKSISNHLAADQDMPITILDTAAIGNYFGILYTDPMDESEGYIHFRYITKAKLYKNHYYNIGGDCRITTDDTTLIDTNHSNESRNTAEVFIVGKGRNYDKKISIFEYNEKSDNPKKIEEIEVPAQPFIIAKTYDLEKSSHEISVQDEFSFIDNPSP